MIICVIENIGNSHEQLVLNLEELYPPPTTTVCPELDRPCRTWKDARKLINKLPKNEELIILMDLALEGEDDPSIGIDCCKTVRLQRKDAIMIAVTSHAKWLERHEIQDHVFDDVIDKGQHDMKRGENLQKLLYKTIEDARCKRAGTVNSTATAVDIRDTLGMRLAQAALGSEVLQELIGKVTVGWHDCVAQTLTSGFSGSYLLELTGTNGGQPAKLVLKVATKRAILDEEATAPNRNAAHLHRFAGKISPAISGVEQLDGQDVFFCIQAKVPGVTLYQLLKCGPKAKARSALQEILDLCIEQYKNAADNSSSDKPKTEVRFTFHPLDLQRIYSSSARLLLAAKTLVNERGWPRGIKSPSVIFGSIKNLANNWERHRESIQIAHWAVQHGDFHPGNIMVAGRQLSFIDLARFGSWPIGYDLSRLATQMRIHLPDHEDERDWLLNGLERWTKEEFGSFDGLGGGDICKWATLCDEAFARFVESRPATEQSGLKRLYMFSTLSDLMRIISYGTLSHFKRIWAAIGCWQLGCRLGFCK